MWLIRGSLRNTHEYLADDGVKKTNANLIKYQSLLLNQINGLSAAVIANNFNSKIKIDIKKRAFAHALDIIRLIDQPNNRNLSVQVIARQLLRSGKHSCI